MIKTDKKDVFLLVLCYVLWGFQPLYWALNKDTDAYTVLGCRILMAALFSVLILAVQGRLRELKAVFFDRKIMKLLLPAVVFLLLDWAVFIVAVNAGHVLDAGLGYYINPLFLFAVGIIVYKEKCGKTVYIALLVAIAGVIVSTAAYGSFPYLSLIIAVNWSVYAAIKKNVSLDGVLSIAAETLLLVPLAAAFLLLFRRPVLAAFDVKDVLFFVGSGVVTALPMFLYSNCVFRFPMTFMCFAQYMSPSFNLICGLMMGESFSKSQVVSFLFFAAAILIFTLGEVKSMKNGE